MDSLVLLFPPKKQGWKHHKGQGPPMPQGGVHPSQQFDLVCDLDTLLPPLVSWAIFENLRKNDPNMDESQALSAFFGDLTDIEVKTARLQR